MIVKLAPLSGSQVVQWLDRDIVNVDQRRVKTVTIAHAGGDRVQIAQAVNAQFDRLLEYTQEKLPAVANRVQGTTA